MKPSSRTEVLAGAGHHLGVMPSADQDLQPASMAVIASPQLGLEDGERLWYMLPVQIEQPSAAATACRLQ